MRSDTCPAGGDAFDLRFGDGIGLVVEERALPNGLRLLLVPEPAKPVLTLMVWVGAGLRREPPGRSGISHVLEHAYSLGSQKLGPRELDAIVNELGGAKNAFTSHDATAYHVNAPSAALGRLVELEADRFQRLALPAGALARELEVIREERRLRVDNQPTGRLREVLLALAYERHPYRHPVIGTQVDLDAMTREAVLEYYRATYTPDNAVAVLAGGFRPEEALALFERWWGEAEGSRGAAAPAVPEEPPQARERREVIDRATPNVPHLALCQKLPAFDHADAAAIEVLGDILIGGRSARLPRRLVRERKLCTALTGGVWGLADPSPLTLIARAQHGVHAEQIEDAIVEVFDEIAAHGVEAGELEEVRARLRVGVLAGLETTQGRASTLGRFELGSRRGYRALGGWFQELGRVSAEEVQRAARRYLGAAGRTVVWQLPTQLRSRAMEIRGRTGKPPRAAPPERPHLPATPPRAVLAPLPPQAPAPPALAAFGERALRALFPNGLAVLVEPTGELPLVAIALAVDAGSASDPAARRGVASLTASLVRTGTDAYDEEALNGAFAALGSTLSASAGIDVTQLSLITEARHLEEGLALLAEVALCPRLEEAKLERTRAEQLSRLRAWRAEPQELVELAFGRALFGPGHPYGWPIAGTLGGVEATQAEDVLAFYRRAYRPAGAVLAIAGAVRAEHALAAAARAFGGWAPGSDAAPAETPPASPRAVAEALVLVPKADQSQAHLRVGLPLFERGHPDWDALALLSAVLGSGGLSARIPSRVRTEQGLAYSARSFLVGRRRGGALALAAETRTALAGRAARLLEEELDRILQEPIPLSELARARARLVGTLPFRRETAAQRAAALVHAHVHGLGPDYLVRQAERFEALTAADLLEAARRHLASAPRARVAVGERAALEAALDPEHGTITLWEEAQLDDARA